MVLTWKTSTNYQCSSTNQILAKSLALSVSLQSDWDKNKIKLPWDSYTCPAVLCFSQRSLIQGIKGSTSQTQGPDGTFSATILNSVKMILEGLSRLKTKVMELNPNFIEYVDVESLLTLFVENFFSSMRGGNTDTPVMLDFCLHFPRCINELLKRVTGSLL